MSEKKLVIGLGNILLKDEGVGVRCIQFMKKMKLNDNIKIVDGATMGFDLLEELDGFKKIIIVDAVDMGKEPGYITSFNAEELLRVPLNEKFSLHEINLVDIVQLGKKLGYDFSNVRIVGIQPKDVSRGDKLSKIIEEKIPDLVERVLREIDNDEGE